MVDLIIENNRARTLTRPPSQILGWYRQLEGRKTFNKEGILLFENTGSNLELWKTHFPHSKIVDEGSLKVFETEIVSNRPAFKFKREPLWWQQEAFDKFMKVGPGKENPLPCFAFLYDPGGGKSKSLTDAICYLWCDNQIDAAIIVAPNDLVAQQWPMSQLPRDVPDNVPSTYWKWDKSKKGEADYEKMKAFDGLQVFCLNIDAVRTPRGMEYLTDFIKRHKGRIMFATDESHLAGNHSSQRHKALDKVMGMCDWRAILTGTLISKNLINAWAQFRLLHPNILGYKYMSSFRAEFCELKPNRFNGFDIIGHKNIDKFYKLIEPYSYRISKDELGYGKMFDEFEFTMDKTQKKVFDELKKTFMTQLENGEFMTVTNALSATVKMQQATNGFLQLEDGSIQLLSTSRLDALDAWLETMPEDEKIVIWCRFLPDAKMIMDHWSKKGSAVEISGNVETSVRQINKERFVNEPNVLYAVATPDAAGTGTDGWQSVCNRGLFYSSSYNSVLRRQSEDRTSRVGGETTSFYTDLICKGGVDRKILNVLKGVADLSKYTLDDIRREFSV